MRQHRFYPDKQQYNNAMSFPVCADAIKTITNVSNMVHESGMSTWFFTSEF